MFILYINQSIITMMPRTIPFTCNKQNTREVDVYSIYKSIITMMPRTIPFTCTKKNTHEADQ